MTSSRATLIFAVVVAAIGYFVDLYDIVIFGVVRVASLTELGIAGDDITTWGVRLFNLQMAGMLIGGFAWGAIGDVFGRRVALIATISVYSAANIANAYIGSVEQYAVLRFLAGFGLAGELGAGVTLVAELLPKNLRGYGTTVISFLGLVGAVTASRIGGHFDWRTAYLAGGLLGVVVLIGRVIGLRESEIFSEHKGQSGQGNVLLLLHPPARLARFLAVVAIGVPIWYVSALFVTLAPELGAALELSAPLRVADVLLYQAIGLAIGSALSGLISEWMQSRKRILYLCFAALVALTLVLMKAGTPAAYCEIMFVVGLAQGYWTAFITLATEQFGTNIRATVSTSVPNLVRAMTIPITLALTALKTDWGLIPTTLALGALVYGLAFVALASLPETYGKDLNYIEP
ncbi:MAG TPA: MFS transporter [Nevskiaceae bacterium]|nr:MFS transporter [Nevskiaceae bacterium]